ncbi:MAG: polyketide synthase, partial [Candidatus Parabeggiatoa sp.]|nr:polyketide synthase [Candidatus Parabeggiatoa sp.]
MKSELGKKVLEMIKNDQVTLEEGTQLIKGIRHNNSINNSGKPVNLEQNLSSRLTTNIPQFRDIAIIGMSGTFPDASDVNEYWNNLTMGKDSVREIPENRWTTDGFYDQVSNTPHADYSQWGGFLSDIDRFDPTFFNISPKEAELMDPQQRRFLQEAWSALEDAGYPPKELA